MIFPLAFKGWFRGAVRQFRQKISSTSVHYTPLHENFKCPALISCTGRERFQAVILQYVLNLPHFDLQAALQHKRSQPVRHQEDLQTAVLLRFRLFIR